MSGRPVVIGLKASHPGALCLAMREALVGRTYVQVVHCADTARHGAAHEVIDAIRPHAVLAEPRTPPVGFAVATSGVVDTLERSARTARTLVLGCRDSVWFMELRPGDIVARLARHADSPVLVVPRGAVTARGPGRVVLATGPLDSSPAAQFALEQATERGHELSLGLERPVGAGDLIVLERPPDPSRPFASAMTTALGRAVATAIDKGCAVSVVPSP